MFAVVYQSGTTVQGVGPFTSRASAEQAADEARIITPLLRNEVRVVDLVRWRDFRAFYQTDLVGDER